MPHLRCPSRLIGPRIGKAKDRQRGLGRAPPDCCNRPAVYSSCLMRSGWSRWTPAGFQLKFSW
eukprot:4205224-Alexandrium_andersonii.AAC.1